jgi:hypothetical protein
MSAAKPIIPLNDDPVAARLASLVNRDYGGNLTAASTAWDVDYYTLWRAAGGRFKRVPLDLCYTIAQWYVAARTKDDPFRWLVSGEGLVPAQRRMTGRRVEQARRAQVARERVVQPRRDA